MRPLEQVLMKRCKINYSQARQLVNLARANLNVKVSIEWTKAMLNECIRLYQIQYDGGKTKMPRSRSSQCVTLCKMEECSQTLATAETGSTAASSSASSSLSPPTRRKAGFQCNTSPPGRKPSIWEPGATSKDTIPKARPPSRKSSSNQLNGKSSATEARMPLSEKETRREAVIDLVELQDILDTSASSLHSSMSSLTCSIATVFEETAAIDMPVRKPNRVRDWENKEIAIPCHGGMNLQKAPLSVGRNAPPRLPRRGGDW